MGKQEEEIVALIRKAFDQATSGVGIGDDAAVFRADGDLVVTADLLIEDVDFTSEMPCELVARKALAVNLSDLAAMGATPERFVLSLGIPPAYRSRIPSFLSELAMACRESRILLIGGDLSAAAKMTVAITAFGRAGRRTLLRSAARVGDRIYLSRPVGGAAAGLALFERGWRIERDGTVHEPSGAFVYAQRELAGAVLRHFAAPAAEVTLGQKMAEEDSIHACIDLSDGISSDLRHICEASSVAARIEWERIPVFPDLEKVGRTLNLRVEDAVLHGGEELALLFTSSARESELSQRFGRPVYAIGSIVEQGGPLITLTRGGADVELADYGFDHFRTM